MKVSTRTQAILAAAVFLFVVCLFIIANAFIQSTYAQIELRQSDTNTRLVSEQFRFEAEELGNLARDWGVWDDTYQFMEDRNPHYYESVINASTTYESLQITGLVYFDSMGRVVAAKGYDPETKTITPLPEETVRKISGSLTAISNIRGGKKRQGVFLLPEGPILVGMHAILQTNGMGFGHGTIVMIQPFDEAHVETVRRHLHLPIRIWRIDAPLPATAPGLDRLSGSDAPYGISRISDASTMTGYFLVTDLANEPALLVGVETPRAASQQMYGTLLYMIVAFAASGILFIIITGLLLRRFIITPLTDLDRAMKDIARKGDLSARLPATGDDEIASLEGSFNAMMRELEEKDAELRDQGLLLAGAHRKANLYLDIYLDVLTYEILNVTISLQAYAELIRESGDATTVEYADRITAALNRNLNVIRNIETISRIYKNPPGHSRVSLKAIVEKETEKFPGVDIRVMDKDTEVIADEMLGVVFRNLFLNSAKFGRNDLVIEVTTRDPGNGTVEISVVDNGIGIADDMKPLIFDRFMKGSDKRSSYGLGLHIVKMLIEAYGGTVRADDRIPGRPEMGAAIRFTLKKG